MSRLTSLEICKFLLLPFLAFYFSEPVLALSSEDGESNQNILLQQDLLEDEVYEEDLFSETVYSTVLFEADESNSVMTWVKDVQLTLQQTIFEGQRNDLSRSEIGFEYEVAPWKGAYARISNKYSYYGKRDHFTGDESSGFGRNKLQEAWLQVSQSSCVGKLGRQGLSWGVIEGAFAVDIISPFDFTEPLLTDYSDIRLSQDMLVVDCYDSTFQFQSFYIHSARLNNYQQTDNYLLRRLERKLKEEWGGRITQGWEGVDVSLMFARLYGNSPVTVFDSSEVSGLRLDVAQYDFIGLSAAWAVGRLLLEVDLGYKQDELEEFSGKERSHAEIAFGFEYTTSNNHQLNANVWIFDGVLEQPNARQEFKIGSLQMLTASWLKTYSKDDLTMSFLGSWLTEFDVLTTTFLGEYQWDDVWRFSSALSYAHSSTETGSIQLQGSGVSLLLKAKLEI